MLALSLSAQLILLIAAGFLVWKTGILGRDFDHSLSALLINVALPCMIVSSFDVPFSPGDLKNLGILIVISIVSLAVNFLIGHMCYLRIGGYSGRILRFSVMFTNFSFIGMPVIEALFGETALLYFVIFTVPARFVYYSGARPLLSPSGSVGEKRTVTQHIIGWLSPPVIAVFVGLFLYITQLRLPEVIAAPIDAIGNICAPLGMMLCGFSLAQHDLRKLLRLRYFRIPLMRNLVIPALTLLILYFLPIDPLVKKVVLIFNALPVASMIVGFTIQYDPEPGAKLESAAGVFLSILFFAVTIPLWSYLAELLFV